MAYLKLKKPNFYTEIYSSLPMLIRSPVMKSMLLFYVQITASQFLGKPCDAPAIVFRVVSKSYAINLIVLLVTPHHSFKVIVE